MLPGDERVVGLALHVRYLGGDATARVEIFERYYEHLVVDLRRLVARRQFFLHAEDIQLVIEDAALKAMASYLERPAQYRPERGKTLGGYLRMSAQGDFRNALKAAIARSRAIDVGFDDEAWNRLADAGDAAEAVEEAIDAAALRERFAGVPETDEERIVLGFMLDGERSNEPVARALGWPGPFRPEQATAINKIKDRLNKRIKRRFGTR
jgi:hypothetical protein